MYSNFSTHTHFNIQKRLQGVIILKFQKEKFTSHFKINFAKSTTDSIQN